MIFFFGAETVYRSWNWENCFLINTSLEFFSTSEFVRVMKYLPTSYEQISKPKTKLQPQEEDERAIKHIKKDVSGRWFRLDVLQNGWWCEVFG